jgi:hypothetical protein
MKENQNMIQKTNRNNNNGNTESTEPKFTYLSEASIWKDANAEKTQAFTLAVGMKIDESTSVFAQEFYNREFD